MNGIVRAYDSVLNFFINLGLLIAIVCLIPVALFLFALALFFMRYDAFCMRQARKKEIWELAERVLGSKESARCWMCSRQFVPGGRRPIDMIGSDKGAEEVTTILMRIEYGLVS